MKWVTIALASVRVVLRKLLRKKEVPTSHEVKSFFEKHPRFHGLIERDRQEVESYRSQMVLQGKEKPSALPKFLQKKVRHVRQIYLIHDSNNSR
ncbi:MAG: hypothetical protein U0518_03450 [Candidatus Gracilibacteria bacterium]